MWISTPVTGDINEALPNVGLLRDWQDGENLLRCWWGQGMIRRMLPWWFVA
jgi:hypothetical protein